jgi:hypothetical protein
VGNSRHARAHRAHDKLTLVSGLQEAFELRDDQTADVVASSAVQRDGQLVQGSLVGGE